MFKTWLAALREWKTYIAETPAAAYGAAMTGLNIVLLFLLIRVGVMLLDSKDKEQESTLKYGTSALIAQDKEHAWRDSAFMNQIRYEYLLVKYNELKESTKKEP